MGVESYKKEIQTQKDDAQYSTEAENRDQPDDNADINTTINNTKDEKQNLESNGGLEAIKTVCSMNINETIFSTLDYYIDMVKDGHLLDLDSYNNYTINKYRDSYLKYIEKDSTRINTLLEYEQKYFDNKYDNSLYNELLNNRKLYFYDLKHNKLDDKDEIFESLYKQININKYYEKNNNILKNELQKLLENKKNINNDIDDLLNNNLNKDIETNNFKNKDLFFLNNISYGIYFVYIIYLCVFISILIINDFYKIITNWKLILLIIFLFLLPSIIYPYVYYNIIIPLFYYIYENNIFTKPLPKNAFNDISNQKFI